MQFFIQDIRTWGPANAKCRELHTHVLQYTNTLIADLSAVHRLLDEIRAKVDDLNRAHPRTKPLAVSTTRDLYVCCHPAERRIADDYVFAFHIHPVVSLYPPTSDSHE